MKNFNREEFKRGNIAVHCEFHKSKGMKIIEWEIDKIKEIEEDNKDMSEFADYLIENASYAFETQDRELLEKVLLNYIDMKLKEQ